MSWQNVKNFCEDNSNTIYSWLGIIFTVGAVVESVRATVKVRKELEDAEYEKWEELGCPEDTDVDISLSKGEVLKLAAPKYIGTTLLLGSAVTCDILANVSSEKKIGQYASVAAAATQMVTSFKESVRDHLPAKDIRKIESGRIHNYIEKDKKNEEITKKIKALQSVGETTTIYRDAYSPMGSGVYFKGTMDQFRKAVNLYNKFLSKYSISTLNDWYDCLAKCGVDIGHSDLGDLLEFAWDHDGPMELYCVPDTMDPDFDDYPIVAIGLRRVDSGFEDLAIPTTPRDAFGNYR